MKITEETSSFKEKHRRGKIPEVSKLSGKRTVIGQDSGELLVRAPKRQFLIFRKGLTRPSQIVFPNHLGRIFQVKGQSEKVNIIIFLLCPFCFIYLKRNHY